jgi:D-alanyl-D-alanine carboxypeptidase
VLHLQRAAEMFIPGSTAKVFSVSAVWHLLGPDHTFTTPVYALGRRRGGQLQGDLVLVGAGDLSLGGRTKPDGTIDYTNFDHTDANTIPGATLTPEDPLAGLKDLARQVRAAGITRVKGDAVVDTPARGQIFAKTGTLVGSDELNARLVLQAKALAGYFAGPEGAWLVFTVVGNNAGGGPTVQPVLAAKEDLGDLAALLWAEVNPDPQAPGRCDRRP